MSAALLTKRQAILPGSLQLSPKRRCKIRHFCLQISGICTCKKQIYNIGNNQPENLLDFVDILQQELVRAGVLPEDYDFEAHKELVPMQPGDVPITYADTSALERDFGFKPSTSLRDGLRKFAEWYKIYYP